MCGYHAAMNILLSKIGDVLALNSRLKGFLVVITFLALQIECFDRYYILA